MTVPSLIGQRQAETLLARALGRGQVAHAYLLLGPSGAGKATAARLFAQAVNCEVQPAVEKAEDRWRLQPCGRCESCRRIQAGTHPEVFEVRPGSKTGQNITVDQARDIRQNAMLRPKFGRWRFYLFPNAEAFNEESANCLLKTLEEPSDFTILVLCAPNPSLVLPTIRSRCQLVRFGFAPVRDVEAALVGRGVEPEKAVSLARVSGGLPGLALTWAEDDTVLERRRKVLELFEFALRAGVSARQDPAYGALSLRLAEGLRALGAGERDAEDSARPAKQVHSDHLDLGLGLLRDLLLLVQGGDPELLHNRDFAGALSPLAPRLDAREVLARTAAVREAQTFLDRNVSPQLVLERMFWGLIAGPLPEPWATEEMLP